MNFLAMRHSKSLEEVAYKDFVNALDPDYSYIDDKKSIWLGKENQLPYDPSSDEGELESERSPPKSEHEEEKPEEENQNPPQ